MQSSATPHHLQAIWDVVSEIPRGTISTYGAVAELAGLPGRARLVGRALRIAPESLHLPWHRVLAAGGRITFPSTSREFIEQRRRLRSEGITVARGRVVCEARAGRPSADARIEQLWKRP